MNQKTTVSIVTFAVLAGLLTFLASRLPAISVSTIDLREILCGFGPLVSGLICYRLFGTPTTYSVVGGQPLKVWGISLVVALICLVTTPGDNKGATALMIVSQLLYCFGEEFGWRHYLQSATHPLHKWLQPFVIGGIWLAWHFTWLPEPLKAMLGSNFNAPLPVGLAIGALALSLFSMFLGWIMQKTNAVLFPTLIHFALKTTSPTLLAAVGLTVLAVLTWEKFKIGTPTNRAQA